MLPIDGRNTARIVALYGYFSLCKKILDVLNYSKSKNETISFFRQQFIRHNVRIKNMTQTAVINILNLHSLIKT